MEAYFKDIGKIAYEGPESDNPLAFRWYDPDKMILGKSMKDHLRFAVCYWHTFCGDGGDPFGGQTIQRPWMNGGDPLAMAELKLKAAFEFLKSWAHRTFAFMTAIFHRKAPACRKATLTWISSRRWPNRKWNVPG